MFGASAYGLVPTKTSIEAITRDDLAAAQRGWMPQTATLIIVGALSPDEGFALAKRLFANWTGKASAAATPRTAAPPGPRIIPVDSPSHGQTAALDALQTDGSARAVWGNGRWSGGE